MAKKKSSKKPVDSDSHRTTTGSSQKARVGSRSKPRQSSKSLTQPSLPTVKQLFAVSRNRCAFRDCRTPMVDRKSGSVLGQVCHIKGEKRGSARFDEKQPDSKRQAFDNLILLCGSHHKIIDDDETTYTVRRLRKMKKDHENEKGRLRLMDSQAQALINNVVTNGSIITSENQSGGQVAHVINNYGEVPDEPVAVEASLSVQGGLDIIERFGCPGLVLKIVCRSRRPARIRNATFCKEGHGFLAKFAEAFGTEFPHSPPTGLESETLMLSLDRVTEANHPDGYILERDEVCRFFLPLTTGGLGAYFVPPVESVTMRAEFSDDSERVLLQGEQILGLLRSLIKTYGTRPWPSKGCARISVRVNSTDFGGVPVSAVGTTNYKSLRLVNPSELSMEDRELGLSVTCEPLIGQSSDGRTTIAFAISKPELQPIELTDISVAILGIRADTKHVKIPFTRVDADIGGSESQLFTLSLELFQTVDHLVQTTDSSAYEIVIRSGDRNIRVLPGQLLKVLFEGIRESSIVSDPPEKKPRTTKKKARTRKRTPKKRR